MNNLILITGSAKGIGSAICEEIAHVDSLGSYYLIFDKLINEVNETRDRIINKSKNLSIVKC